MMIFLSSSVRFMSLLNCHWFSSSGFAPIGPAPVSPGLHPWLYFLLGRTLHSLLPLHQVSSLPRTRNLVASFQLTPSHLMLLSRTALATSSADSLFVMLGYKLTASLPMMTILLVLSCTHLLSTSLLFTLLHLAYPLVLLSFKSSLLSLSRSALFLFPLCVTEVVTYCT